MTLPLPRDVQIDGNWRRIRGNQILDSYEFNANNPDAAAAENLIQNLTAKLAAENWAAEENTNLITVAIYLHGYRDMNPTESGEVAQYDQMQDVEFQQYLKLKEKFG